MMDHSLLAPSNADQWVECAGSVQMNLLAGPKTSNETAIEGDTVHDIGAELVEGVTRGQLPGKASSKLWDTTRNGVFVTKEMVDSALMYAKHIEKLIQYTRVFGGPNIGIERQIEIHGIHPACFGTPDFFIYDSDEKHLTVYELKYGYGVVEVFENWQLICYTKGIIELLGIVPEKISLIVVQPRAPHKDGPIRGWIVNNPPDLEPYFERLKNAAALAMGSSPQTKTGPHCRYCPSLLNCETARSATDSALDVVGGLKQSTINENSLWFRIAILKRAQEMIKHELTAYESEVESKMRAGQLIPRFKMSPKMSNAFWTIPHEQIIELGKTHGHDLNVEKALTPKQAMTAGIPEDIVKAFSKREKRGVKLELDDLKQARFVFNAGKGE